MATPSYSYVIDQINTFIVANGNNEITANVLNPILEVITDFANNHMGNLDNLTTDETDTLVDSINSLKQNINDIVGNSVQLHVGNANPNDTPPSTYNYGDFYMQLSPLDNEPIQLWQFNGFEWFAPDAAPSWGDIEGNIADQTDLQSELDLKANVTDLEDYQLLSEKGEANGYTPLDSGAKVPIEFLPDSLVGQVTYQGTWDASTNTPDVGDATTKKGYYYVTSVAGTYSGISYEVGDWIISNGVEWQKVDNTDAVVSVFGRIGAVVANSGDYAAFYEPIFSKNTGFNKNFGTTAGTVSEGNHTHTFASLISKPTTIAGYGITDFNSLGDARWSPIITGGASSIVSANLTVNRALVSNLSGKVAVSDITSTELGYLDNVTSNIQTQLNSKLDTTSGDARYFLSTQISYTTSIDNIEVSGHYRLETSATGVPSGESSTGSNVVHYQWNSNTAKQVFYSFNTNNSYWRRKNSGTWGAWQKYWTNTNDGSGSGLDADLLRGVHWGNVNTNIVTSGTVTATNFILSSDKRLKENIKKYKVKDIPIKLKTYKLKGSDSEDIGVIAQELEKTSPEFVVTNEEGMKSVKYIQLLLAKVAELEARIKMLEL